MSKLSNRKEKVIDFETLFSALVYRNLKLECLVEKRSVKIGKISCMMFQDPVRICTTDKEFRLVYVEFESDEHISLAKASEMKRENPELDIKNVMFEKCSKNLEKQIKEATQKMLDHGCKKVVRVFVGGPWTLNADGTHNEEQCIGIVQGIRVAMLGN